MGNEWDGQRTMVFPLSLPPFSFPIIKELLLK